MNALQRYLAIAQDLAVRGQARLAWVLMWVLVMSIHVAGGGSLW